MRIATLLAVGLMTAAVAAPARSLRAVKAQFPLGSSAILEQPDRMVLYALDPGAAKPKGATFHGFAVIGRMPITDTATRRSLNEALRRGDRENDSMAAACFNPRHGIHATSAGNVLDLVICFECYSAQVHEDGQRKPGFLLSESPQKTFDQTLRAGGVQPATRRE